MGKTRQSTPASEPGKPSRSEHDEARELLEEAGSAELARQAVDSASGHPARATQENDAFAKQWGFGSYLEMFEASKPAAKRDGKDWLVTNIGADRWIVWNDQELQADHIYRSFQEAAEHAGHTGKPSDAERRPPPTG